MAQIISKEELMDKYDRLYEKMAASGDVANMKLFGSVMRKAIEKLAMYRPEEAEDLVDELCAMNWKNFLTRKEAAAIVAKMDPQPRWSYEQIASTLAKLELPMEEAPYYNSQAMYVGISMKYSDNAHTIAERLLLKSIAEVGEVDMLKMCYYLAKDSLKDKDGVFNIRKYFGLNHDG